MRSCSSSTTPSVQSVRLVPFFNSNTTTANSSNSNKIKREHHFLPHLFLIVWPPPFLFRSYFSSLLLPSLSSPFPPLSLTYSIPSLLPLIFFCSYSIARFTIHFKDRPLFRSTPHSTSSPGHQPFFLFIGLSTTSKASSQHNCFKQSLLPSRISFFFLFLPCITKEDDKSSLPDTSFNNNCKKVR